MTEQRDSVELALDRILAIEWRIEELRGKSHKALMLEYFRRIALWSKVLGLKRFPTWVFLDIPLLIEPSIKLGEAHTEALKPIGKKVNSTAQRVCDLYLRWTCLESTFEETRYALPAPYEPLIRVYERGGIFSKDMTSDITFEGGPAVPIPRENHEFDSLCARVPLPDLNDYTLDQLDSR